MSCPDTASVPMILSPPILAGDDAAWTQSLFLADRVTPCTSFTDADELAVTLWTGVAGSPAIAPGFSAAWSNAPAGIYTLLAPGASTVSLAAGFYWVLVEILVARSGARRTAFLGRVEILGRPGPPPPVVSPARSTPYFTPSYFP